MMKKNFFFFRSSINDANKTPSPPLKSKEVSSWKSVSLSSGSFYDSGSGKKNFMDLRKSPHGHSKKVHTKKSSRDSSRDLSIPVLIRTIRRLTKKKVQMASEVSCMLRNQYWKRSWIENPVIVHQNSTCGATENVGTTAKSNSIMHEPGSASWTSICWFTCSTSCVFYPVWSDSKEIKLAWGYNISCRDNACSASSSKGCGLSVKRSSRADVGHLSNPNAPCIGDGSTWNNIEGFNSDKSIDSGRPSLALRSSSFRSVVQELEVGSSYVDRNLEHNSSLVVCSSSGLERKGGDSSTSTSANQQILDLNLALAFQENLSDPRITSMLKRKGRHTDCELANLLQDKGLDPNFAVMLKENRLDLMILALLQRSSLDADREHHDSNHPVTDSNNVENVLPNHNLFLEELRLQGLEKWLQRCRVILLHVAGTPDPAPGAIPSMSLQFQPMLPAQQANSYGFGSSKKLLPLGHANVAMYQPSQIQFPQPIQQVTGRPIVGMHSMPQGPPIPHDFQQNLLMSNNHMPGSGGPNLPLSSSYNKTRELAAPLIVLEIPQVSTSSALYIILLPLALEVIGPFVSVLFVKVIIWAAVRHYQILPDC
ncbi:hypothetical protein FXO37_32441 [Capsicum annuum]|nr:hypothetical protein FXO37_32441 [Capsicum annuum]